MQLKIKKAVADAVGLDAFEEFGIDRDTWSWRGGSATIDIANLSKAKLGRLQRLIEKSRSAHGAGVLLRDIETWKKCLADTSGKIKARTVRHFETMLTQFLLTVPRHHVYRRVSEEVWLPCYVSETEYVPEREHAHSRTAEHVVMTLAWQTLGGRQKDSVVFWAEDCRGMGPLEALARMDFFPATPELRARHEAELVRFGAISQAVGAQYHAVGTGTDNLDGNPSHGYWESTHTYQLVREGQPTRVVVDVFYEDDKSDREERDRYMNTDFWWYAAARGEEQEGDDDGRENIEDERPTCDVPVHPFLAVFDMSKHLRMRVHVGYLTPYVYDAGLSEKLVLPDKMKSLVKMLIEHKDGGFRDIVKGKSGGAVVLLCGPPGVGKTLTAEVYAESEQRALYSVQCSQLGTDPEDLETELLKVFARARRWNAVLLLDEADVYVHTRGRDLHQNAIVGVFLRVLEYQSSVLFLTTNRPEDVDDAIASRCVARLNYPIPTPLEQKRIWRILADGSGAVLRDSTIDRIVASHTLSGRDVKNLLKLALLMKGKAEILESDIEFVRQFQPTVLALPQSKGHAT